MTVAPYKKSNPETIRALFANIAKKYDRGNAVLSFQMHRLWNARLVSMLLKKGEPEALLDLCAGTGDIAFGLLKRCHGRRSAVLLDFCGEMLDVAKEKAERSRLHKRHDISYLQGDAQEIALPDNSVDAVSIAYGIRNVEDPTRCFSEVRRVLKPGCQFGILELTQPKNSVLRGAHCFYLNRVLPVLGKLVASDQDAYQYLCDSIQKFTPADQLADMLRNVGFTNIEIHPLLGGIATILVAK